MTDASDTQKSSRNILVQQIEEGMEQLRRPPGGLFLSGLSAGLDLGFGPLLMATVLTLAGGGSALLVESLAAGAYTVGFVFVILGRTELFTEYTTLAVLPVLDGQATPGMLGRLWAMVFLGNVVGGLAFAAFAVAVGPAFDIFDPRVLAEIARPFVAHRPVVLFGGALLAGWLMGLLSWLVAAARDTLSRVFFVWLVTFVIGLFHLPHSVAGNIELLFALFGPPDVTLLDYGRFLGVTAAGNAVGGTVFVTLLKYGHVVHGDDSWGGWRTGGPPERD